MSDVQRTAARRFRDADSKTTYEKGAVVTADAGLIENFDAAGMLEPVEAAKPADAKAGDDKPKSGGAKA